MKRLSTLSTRSIGMGKQSSANASYQTEYNATAPALAPTLGAEILTNGSMEAGNPPSSWTATGATLTGAADERTGGAGVQSINNANSGAAGGIAYQAVTVTAHEFYRLTAWGKKITTNLGMSLQQNGGAFSNYGSQFSSSTNWAQMTLSALPLAAAIKANLANSSSVAGQEARYDDVSLKQLTFSSLRAYLVTRTMKNGTYICHPTMVAGSHCGLLCEYLDDNNWVLVVISRVDNTAKIISKINGTCTIERTGAITFTNGQELKLVVNEGVHQLFYNGVQIGADVTINTAGLGYQVHGFSTHADSSGGLVTTNP